MKIRVLLSLIVSFAVSKPSYAQWVQTNGPFHDGYVSSIAVSGATVVAASDSGIFSSLDYGENWIRKDSSFRPFCLTFHGSNLFAGNGLNGSGGVFLSTDNGSSWNHAGLSDTGIYCLVTFGTELIAGTNLGIFITTDDGKDWIVDSFNHFGLPWQFTPHCFALTIVGHTFFAGTERGIWKSSEFGNWLPTNFQQDEAVWGLAFSGGNLIAERQYSSDSGSTWHAATGANWSLEPDPTTYSVVAGHVFAANEEGVYRSEDNGETWRTIFDYAYTVAATSEGHVFCGTGNNIRGGLYRSTNYGDDWSLQLGLMTASVGSLVNIGPDIVAKSDETFISKDSGSHWRGITHRNIIYAGSYGSRLFGGSSEPRLDSTIYLSTDEGVIWKAVADTSLTGETVKDFTHNSTAVFALSSRGVLQSIDSGNTWKLILKQSSNKHFETLAASDSLLLLGTYYDTNYRSTNNGLTWTNMGLFYHDIGVLAATKQFIFAGSGSNLFRSKRSDTNWVHADVGIRCHQFVSLIPYSGRLFAGTDSGVYLSTNDGLQWYSCNEGLTDSAVYCLAIAGSYLYTGTSRGVWRRPLSDFGIQAAVQEHLLNALTVRIYPNPTASSTTISITPEASGYAEISIVNMLGQTVAQVYSGVLDASEHSFTWEAQAKACATPGVYECVVRMNGRVQALPIVVTR